MKPYIYNKLGSSEQLMIRIFVLAAGTVEDPLRGELETHPLPKVDEEENSTQRQQGGQSYVRVRRTACSSTHTGLQIPHYEAISYRWGSNKRSTITCSKGSIDINENLDRALKALRYQEKTRRLWIDQICINQNDTDERSHQVKHMRQIYSLAERTVVWLGEDDENQGLITKDLFDKIQRMGVCRSIGYHTTIPSGDMQLTELSQRTTIAVAFAGDDQQMTVNQNPWFPTDDLLTQHDLPKRSCKAWPAFNALLQMSYFTRVWTLQEVLSSQEAVILWGSTELSWASLRNAYHWATLNGCMTKDMRNDSLGGPSLHRVEFLRLELRWFRGFCDLTLVQLVETCRDAFDATDPRDQIYAFVGLASDGGNFAVDYRKNVADTFIDFAKHRLEAGDLTTLNLAGLHKPQGTWEARTDPKNLLRTIAGMLHIRSTPKTVPSWVPALHSRLRIGQEISSIEKPVVPLVGTLRGSVGWSPDLSSNRGFRTEYRDFSASYDIKASFKKAERREQWLVKGFRLAQAKVVCTSQAYDNSNYEDHGWKSMTAQYDSLFSACASPSDLQAMICCMTSALQAADTDEEHDPMGNPYYSYNYDELSAQFISFVFNSMLESLGRRGLSPEEVGGLEMIYRASASLEENATRMGSDFSRLTPLSQQDMTSRLQRFKRGQLKQDEVDEAIEAIKKHWTHKRAHEFSAYVKQIGFGRKMFLTDGKHSHVGIGPAQMTTTDIIVIAYGGQTPYVLRPVPGTQPEEYVLLGDCYIHDLMYGSALGEEYRTDTEWFCLGTEPSRKTSVGRHFLNFVLSCFSLVCCITSVG